MSVKTKHTKPDTKKNTPFNRDEFIKEVRHHLAERYKVGTLKSEADFLAGAGVIFDHLEIFDQFPVSWFFCPVRGKSVIKELSQEDYNRAHGH